jgi:DNA-binding MurR/RpiR family transcriptional regulator
LEYGNDDDDLEEIAGLLLKREKIEIAGIGNMATLCSISSKFTFPYSKNMVIIEVASEKSHQSVKKYCDQTQRDVNRKGFTLSNLLSLSILDKLK